MKQYKLPDYALQDYLASYAGPRFFEAMAFVRDYPESLPRLAKRLAEVNVPCQITVGKHDPFVPVSNAEGLHKGLPKSRLNVLDLRPFRVGKTPLRSTESSPQTLLKVATHTTLGTEFATCLPVL